MSRGLGDVYKRQGSSQVTGPSPRPKVITKSTCTAKGRWDRRPWAGTGVLAIEQPLYGIHAARALLLSGPEGSPEQAGGVFQGCELVARVAASKGYLGQAWGTTAAQTRALLPSTRATVSSRHAQPMPPTDMRSSGRRPRRSMKKDETSTMSTLPTFIETEMSVIT